MFSPYAPNLSFIWDLLSSFLGIKLVARTSWDCSLLILEVIEGKLIIIIGYLILHQKKIRIQFQCHKRISMGKKWKVSSLISMLNHKGCMDKLQIVRYVFETRILSFKYKQIKKLCAIIFNLGIWNGYIKWEYSSFSRCGSSFIF